jgi:hypothetical protein
MAQVGRFPRLRCAPMYGAYKIASMVIPVCFHSARSLSKVCTGVEGVNLELVAADVCLAQYFDDTMMGHASVVLESIGIGRQA